ncbi:MAG: gamma-glutamyl kinase [Pseudomonadota bacterium]
MLVSTRHSLAILAMPKTGTTAIETVLKRECEIAVGGDPGLKHMTLRRFERFVRPLLTASGFGDVETVCLIREPADWLISWYRYRQRAEVADPTKSTVGISFERFVEGYLAPDQPVFAQVGRPSRFLSDKTGRMAVDHLFRYERFDALEAFLSRRVGKRLFFPMVNGSVAARPHIAPTLRARIEAGMAEEYRIWHDLAQ